MRVPMRMNWMWGIARRRVRMRSRRASESSRGSPPQSRTSRTEVACSRYSKAASHWVSSCWSPTPETTRERVQ